MKKRQLFNDGPEKKGTFEIVCAQRDSLGNPIPGKFKHFSTDSAYKLSAFYLRCNPPRKNKAKKSELPVAGQAEAILAEVNNSSVAPAEKENASS